MTGKPTRAPSWIESSSPTPPRSGDWPTLAPSDKTPAGNTTLIIAVPDAPGVPPLAGVAAEAAALANLIPGAQLLQHPTRQGVLAALPDHNVAHFACHGYSDWENPLPAGWLLYDH